MTMDKRFLFECVSGNVYEFIDNEKGKISSVTCNDSVYDIFLEIVDLLNKLEEENEQLVTKCNSLEDEIDELEDDNTKYHKSLKKLEDYSKRFIPTEYPNEFKDCKTNRYYWLDWGGVILLVLWN